jgi:hypothetical protein
METSIIPVWLARRWSDTVDIQEHVSALRAANKADPRGQDWLKAVDALHAAMVTTRGNLGTP